MPTRPARFEELEPISRICAAAFFSDAIFGDMIHPLRHEYPDDMHLYWLKQLRSEFSDGDSRILVATTAIPGGSSRGRGSDEVLVGMAHWIRRRASTAPPSHGGADKSEGSEGDDDGGLPPNRAADPRTEGLIERCIPYIADKWQGPRAESWYLDCLAVDPQYQRRGHGRSLVAFGLELAAEEKVCASLISCEGQEDFYRSCGFDKQAGTAGDGEGNPLRGVKGALVMFKDA